jgi:molybdopterin-guanine dinucleotide biosynthesis protein A
MRYSALLLAGGKSSRMGCDKALLEIDDQPLWLRQIQTLRELSPEQLLIAGPQRESGSEFEFVTDEMPEAGPLGGVAAALQRCSTLHLVVLAVDLPQMRAEFLRSLFASCQLGQGVVPRTERGSEPLAAIYPVSCCALALDRLGRGDFSMQNFVRCALAARFLIERLVSPDEEAFFANLNTPADYERARQCNLRPRR